MLVLSLLPAAAWTVYLHLDRYCGSGYSCNRDHYRDPDQKEKMPQLQDQMQKERQMLPELRSATKVLIVSLADVGKPTMTKALLPIWHVPLV